MSPTMRAFVFLAKFIITKQLKQEADDNLSNCMHSPCSLSITGDMKIYQCNILNGYLCYYLQWRSTLCTSIKEMFLLATFDNSSL